MACLALQLQVVPGDVIAVWGCHVNAHLAQSARVLQATFSKECFHMQHHVWSADVPCNGTAGSLHDQCRGFYASL
jgi:hypothetical protein